MNKYLLTICSLLVCTALSAQKELSRDINLLCSTFCEGRATGTPGNTSAAFYLAQRYLGNDMLPLTGTFFHPFDTGNGKVGHNVIGLLPSNPAPSLRERPRKYVILMAKFDGLGKLSGVVYPGADSNASGVAAMLSICDLIHEINLNKRYYPFDIIVVGLDACQINNAGSKALYQELADGKLLDPVTGKIIKANQVKLVVNLELLGTAESKPQSGRSDFLVMLGASEQEKSKMAAVNRNNAINLQVCHNYFGSQNFTKVFYNKVGAQSIFVEKGFPTIMFTSGITMNTNKETDTPETIDYKLLEKRTMLIYRWLAARAY